jgi:hypothetical protein
MQAALGFGSGPPCSERYRINIDMLHSYVLTASLHLRIMSIDGLASWPPSFGSDSFGLSDGGFDP